MAGSTNFLIWNPGAANQESDSAYAADSQRLGGAPTGTIFPSATGNKLFYQLSSFVTALANALANKGYTITDTNFSALESALANLVTFSDLKSNLTSVAFSTSPAFNASSTNGFDIVLAGNVTGSTLTGQQVGQTLTFIIVQGSTPYSFVPPSIINGWIPIDMTPNSVTIQTFIVRENGSIWPTATEINVILAELAALIAGNPTTIINNVLSSRSFSTNYQNTSGFKMTVASSGNFAANVGHNATIQGFVGTTSGSQFQVAANSCQNGGGLLGVTFVVPPGYWYSVQCFEHDSSGGTITLSSWVEWIN